MFLQNIEYSVFHIILKLSATCLLRNSADGYFLVDKSAKRKTSRFTFLKALLNVTTSIYTSMAGYVYSA